MAQFATAAELADRLGVEFTAAQETRADALLTLTSGLVQKEARQTIELVEDDELTRLGSNLDGIRLPERPVVSVASVELAGEALTEGEDFYVDGDTLLRVPRLSSATFNTVSSAGWGYLDDELVVTYTHGYATIPDAVKAVVLEAVARVWTNPGALISERLGQAQMTYAVQGTPTGLLLTGDERRTIRETVRRGASTIQLR